MKKEELRIVCIYDDKENIDDIISDSFRRYVNYNITEEYKIIPEQGKNDNCEGK